MAASRTATRSLRALRPAARPVRLTTRRYATGVNTGNGSASSSSSAGGGMGPALTGGVVGGSLVFLAAYGYYHFSGAKTMVNSLHQTKAYFDGVSLQELLVHASIDANDVLGSKETPIRNSRTQRSTRVAPLDCSQLLCLHPRRSRLRRQRL